MKTPAHIPDDDDRKTVLRRSKRPGQEPWEQEHRGLRWHQMPRQATDDKLLLFALFRMGLVDVQMDLERDESLPVRRAAQMAFGGRGGLRYGQMRRVELVKAKQVREAKVDLAEREALQKSLIAKFVSAKQTPNFTKRIYELDPTAHCALTRAMGRGGRPVKGVLRMCSLQRIEKAFETLKKEGWANL